MINTLSYLIAALCAATAIGKLRPGHQRRSSPTRRFFALGVLSLGVSFATAAPATRDLAASLEPLPHTTRFVGNTLGMLAGCCALAMLSHALHEPARARQLVQSHFLILATVVLARLALLTITMPAPTTELTATHAADPLVATYVMLHAGYLAMAMAQFSWLTRRYATRSASPGLRVGLRLTFAGLAFGGIWASWKTTIVLTQLLGAQPMHSASDISLTLAAFCGLFITAGACHAAWARRLHALLRPLRIRRAYARLEPLWATMTAAMPQVHLGAATTPDEALYRRVIEVRDAQFALNAHLPGTVAADTERLLRARADVDPNRAAVIIDAACLEVALDSHRTSQASAPSPPPPQPPARDDRTHLLDEAAWLAQVEQARRNDPTVATIRQAYRCRAAVRCHSDHA